MVAIVVSCVRRFLTFCLDDLQRGDSCLEAETRHQSPTISGNNCPTCYSDICILAFMAEVCVVLFALELNGNDVYMIFFLTLFLDVKTVLKR